MKVCIITNTIYAVEPEFIRYTDSYKQEYCIRHDIDYIRLRQNPHPNLHPQWCKPEIMLAYANKYDWMVWMDADATILGMDFDLKRFLSSYGDNVIMQKDALDYNNGVFAMPCRRNSLAWLKAINEKRNLPKYRNGWREQQAMIDSFKNEWRHIVVHPPAEIGFNSYLNIYNHPNEPHVYEEGHWCLHLPGIGDGHRLSIFKNKEWLKYHKKEIVAATVKIVPAYQTTIQPKQELREDERIFIEADDL